MELHELVIEMKLIERRLTLYEEKYGILSRDFYNALMAGKLERYDAYDETRADFSRWKGIYEIWLRRKETDPKFGSVRGQIKMSDDFNESLTVLEKKHRDGYEKHPVVRGEFDGWETERV